MFDAVNVRVVKSIDSLNQCFKSRCSQKVDIKYGNVCFGKLREMILTYHVFNVHPLCICKMNQKVFKYLRFGWVLPDYFQTFINFGRIFT